MNRKLTNQMLWASSITKGYRGGLLLYFVLEIVAIALSLLFVLWSKKAIDSAMSPESTDLKWMLVLVVVSVLLALILRSISSWVMERIRLRMGLQLQNQMIEVQMMSAWKVVKDWHSGDIQVRIHSDSKEVVSMVSYNAISFLLTLIRLLASFGFLWSMDPMLALMIVAITPLFFFSKLYFRKMRRLSREIKAEESNFGKVLQENLRFRMLIRGMDLLNGRRKKLIGNQEAIYDLKLEQLNFSTLTQGGLKMTINIGYLVTFVWGVYRLQSGQISFGTMTAFLQLVGRIQAPILALIGFAPVFIRFRTSVERLMELVAGEKEVPMNPQKMEGIQSLTLEGLNFKYEDYYVIKGLSMTVRRAESAAIVGSSGKGKTTLIRLLLAILQPESGNIWLEDNNGTHRLTAGHRVNFAYVPQGNTLFSGTIRENILITNDKDAEERMKYALWLACAEFVYDLPEGLDTMVGELGHGLSEGQAQRIAIARAMMRDSDIYLFDEITSALDKETAEVLISRILKVGKDKICLFVTHDFELAEKCNQVITLEK